MPINFKGLCYLKPCIYDIGTRFSTSGFGYYSAFITSTDNINVFTNWKINYDGQEIFGGGFSAFFQSLGGDYLEGSSGLIGTQGFFFIKTLRLADDIIIKDENDVIVLTITFNDLDFNPPSNCAVFTIDPLTTSASQIQGYGSQLSSDDYGYIATGFGKTYEDEGFRDDLESLFQNAFGNSITTVTVSVTTIVEITFNNIYSIPSALFDFNNTPFVFTTTPCP